ncbi:metal ABC transporter solute-binding protein, Zn/Mn family [Kozakia baliensis]|uniref:Uncharacterized protein n=1 Tax=Kozakia baliensis TaxID=153496 RepID=A0A1D8UWF0_9PROT|nr:zinc ABC transporter substrate-binding protein [Kozakia baliensis]AOX17941.1 hypothetical protein A0U89_13315 [Kozakia baliensis]GEL64398.1 ABC transporter substrate-binding protein [Kozakia baliensis]
MRRSLLVLLALCAASFPIPLHAAPLRVVCAEAVWCNIAQQLGGETVHTDSILTSRQIDPHDFQVSPETARRVAQADIVVENGAEYDSWVDSLLDGQENPSRDVINIGQTASWRPGDNPHLFDDVRAVRLYAERLTDILKQRLPDKKAELDTQAAAFAHDLDKLQARLSTLRFQFNGVDVAASEPIGGPLFKALGISVTDPDFALAIMNHNEPSPEAVANLEDTLRHHDVRALIINPVVSDPAVDRLIELAQHVGVPVLPLMEMLPADQNWQDWLNARIDAIAQALRPS